MISSKRAGSQMFLYARATETTGGERGRHRQGHTALHTKAEFRDEVGEPPSASIVLAG
jgi:hypothetical protein